MSRPTEPAAKQPGLTEMLSAKCPTAPSDGDPAVAEPLVNDGKLVAIPPGGTTKPRRFAVAALHDGGEILLYLSRATTAVGND